MPYKPLVVVIVAYRMIWTLFSCYVMRKFVIKGKKYVELYSQKYRYEGMVKGMEK
jgi:hypothetical protein